MWIMLAMARSCAVVGLEGALIEVEVDTSHGLAMKQKSASKQRSRIVAAFSPSNA
jgi:hypothetical protein